MRAVSSNRVYRRRIFRLPLWRNGAVDVLRDHGLCDRKVRVRGLHVVRGLPRWQGWLTHTRSHLRWLLCNVTMDTLDKMDKGPSIAWTSVAGPSQRVRCGWLCCPPPLARAVHVHQL